MNQLQERWVGSRSRIFEGWERRGSRGYGSVGGLRQHQTESFTEDSNWEEKRGVSVK